MVFEIIIPSNHPRKVRGRWRSTLKGVRVGDWACHLELLHDHNGHRKAAAVGTWMASGYPAQHVLQAWPRCILVRLQAS